MNTEYETVSDGNLLAVKARFKSIPMNLYGQLIIMFNNSEKFENFNGVISTYSDAYDLELHTGWDRYQEFIADLKWKGHFNNNLTTTLMSQLTDMADDYNTAQRFYKSVTSYDYDKVDIALFDLVSRIMHEKNLVLESVIQEITPAEYADIMKKRSKPVEKNEPSAESNSQLGKDAVVLITKPILSPVKGKPIYELKVGDVIMTRVTPNSERQNYYIDLMQLREDREIKPVPSEVIDIKAGKGKNEPVEILTRIGRNIYGKLIEEEKQVKLRMYNPDIDSVRQKNGQLKKTEKSTASSSKLSLYLLLIAFIALTIFSILIFFSW